MASLGSLMIVGQDIHSADRHPKTGNDRLRKGFESARQRTVGQPCAAGLYAPPNAPPVQTFRQVVPFAVLIRNDLPHMSSSYRTDQENKTYLAHQGTSVQVIFLHRSALIPEHTL